MASYDGLQVRALLSRGVVVQNGADTPIAIRLRYVGTGTVTSVTITTATNIVMVTSDGGTDTYTFATYTTIGALADAINNDGIFEAKILDALRSDVTTASYFVTGAITAGTDANGVVVWDCLVDTSVYKAVTSCISFSRNFNTTMLARSHRVHLQQISYFGTLGGAGANLVRVYLRRNGTTGLSGVTETQIYGATSVSATATSITFASGFGKISGQDGDELIVRLQDGTSLSDTALSLQAIGILE